MKFKLTNIQTNQSIEHAPTDKTHQLSFTEVLPPANPEGGLSPMHFGASSMSLRMTAAEAAGYVLGDEYEIEVLPASS